MTKMKLSLVLIAALTLSSFVWAQEHKAAEPATAEPQKASETKSEPAAGEHQAAGPEAAAEHGEAKKEGGEAEADSHKQFTESPSVKWVARKLGIEVKTAYWLSVLINFALLGLLFRYIAKNGLPGIFGPIGPALRDRQLAIEKGISEAREASAKAAARLTEIEARLGKLDTEIATMRSQAEAEARAEEERLKAATEEEKRKIVQSAEQEITAAANSARRDLKNLAAELAVALAEKQISVDEATDKMLVRDFSAGLNQKGGN